MKFTKALALGGSLAVLSTGAFAAGFEKVTQWSAKWSSLAGAAAASVDGADALYFNPAGLVKGKKQQLSVNLSPTLSKFKGPAFANRIDEGEKNFSPVLGLLYKHALSEKLALGAGFYVSGGTKSKYESLKPTSNSTYTLRPNSESDLKVFEVGLGAGYMLNKNWSVGATWRASIAKASLSSPAESGTNVVLYEYSDLKDEDFASFRLGLQYESDNKNWGAGLAYRSQVSLTLDGTAVRKTETASGTFTTGFQATGKTAQVGSYLPQQVALGGFFKLNDSWTFFTEHVWTEYGKLDKLDFKSNDSLTAITLNQAWKNQLNHKFALEKMFGDKWAMRLGYALTTQVTPNDRARATFASPGRGHTVTAGVGCESFDIGLERSWASGPGDNADSLANKGEYETYAYALHLSYKYNF